MGAGRQADGVPTFIPVLVARTTPRIAEREVSAR